MFSLSLSLFLTLPLSFSLLSFLLSLSLSLSRSFVFFPFTLPDTLSSSGSKKRMTRGGHCCCSYFTSGLIGRSLWKGEKRAILFGAQSKKKEKLLYLSPEVDAACCQQRQHSNKRVCPVPLRHARCSIRWIFIERIEGREGKRRRGGETGHTERKERIGEREQEAHRPAVFETTTFLIMRRLINQWAACNLCPK